MYKHFIAVDWAKANMAVARMSQGSNSIKVVDVPTNLGNLKDSIDALCGTKILTIEETTTSQWLFTELRPLVDELVVCDPYRNKLLSDGAKNDSADAKKLVQLLKAGLLRPVFHSGDYFLKLRRLVSGYNDMIIRGVRLKNQRSAIYRYNGRKVHEAFKSAIDEFVLEGIEEDIERYELERKRYAKKLKEEISASPLLKYLDQIPGIGEIGAIKIASYVVDAKRFETTNRFLAYCGLVKLDEISGGKYYGSRTPRHRRDLKAVFKTAALSVISGESDFAEYYNYLIRSKNYPEFQARHAVARKIAIASYGVMNSKSRFNPKKIGALRNLTKQIT
jgi:transposase